MAKYNTFEQLFDKITQEFNKSIEESYQKIATITKDYFVEQFDKNSTDGNSSSTNDLGTWAKLEKSTLAYKKLHGNFGNDKLKTTGDMYDALTKIDTNWTRTGKGIKLFIDSKYAKYHHKPDATGNMVRPFMVVTPQLVNKITNELAILIEKINGKI